MDDFDMLPIEYNMTLENLQNERLIEMENELLNYNIKVNNEESFSIEQLALIENMTFDNLRIYYFNQMKDFFLNAGELASVMALSVLKEDKLTDEDIKQLLDNI
jgi:hypothetical protein